MRAVVTALCLVTSLSGAAFADVSLEPETIPEQCRAIAKQAATPNRHTALSARISLANCLSDVKLAPLKLVDSEASMLEIDEAMKDSFDLLDEVVAGADPVTQIVAERARAELY